MLKTATYIGFIAVAIFVSGAFGGLHDQISYTVSPEYFTKFKFIQFRLLDPSTPERIRAAQVGFLASWWMGIPLGLLSGLAGFVHPTAGQMRTALLYSLPVMIIFVLIFALCGLAYGYVNTDVVHVNDGWYFPSGLTHPRRFLCAGYMHNAAYLGGVAAIPVAWAFHVVFWWRAKRAG